MNPVVLATDGSPAALEATGEAIRLAEALGEDLIIVSVEHVSPPTYGYAAYGYTAVYSELVSSEHEHVQRVLEDAERLAADAGLSCEAVAVKDGAIAETICDLAKRRDARLIVMGSHGWNAVRRLVFGSVSTGVLHHATCPVLVVHAPEDNVERTEVDADAAVI